MRVRRNALILMSVLAVLLAVPGCGGGGGSGGAGGDYVWTLVEVVDHVPEDYSSQEEGFEFDYTFRHARDSYQARWLYTGEPKAISEIVAGEFWAVECSFSQPPETLVPGETLSQEVTIRETESNLSGWAGTALANAKFTWGEEVNFTASSSEDLSLTTGDGINVLEVNTLSGVHSLEGTLSAVVPDGSPGDRIQLRNVLVLNAFAQGNTYVYEMKRP